MNGIFFTEIEKITILLSYDHLSCIGQCDKNICCFLCDNYIEAVDLNGIHGVRCNDGGGWCNSGCDEYNEWVEDISLEEIQ